VKVVKNKAKTKGPYAIPASANRMKVTQAKAGAEALRIQKQEVTPELIRLREIEAQREAVGKWNGILPNVTGGTIPIKNNTNKEQYQ